MGWRVSVCSNQMIKIFQSQISVEEAVQRLATSRGVQKLLEGREYVELREFLEGNPECPMDCFPDGVFDALIQGLIKDECFSYGISSDDEGNPTGAGPWPAELYGFAGVWVFTSPEMEFTYFLDRDDGIAYVMGNAREIIYKQVDRPIQPWQLADTSV